MIRAILIQIINSINGYFRRKKTPPETLTTADEAIDILEYGWLTRKEFFSVADYMNRITLTGEEKEKFSRSEILEIIVHEPWYDDWLDEGKQK